MRNNKLNYAIRAVLVMLFFTLGIGNAWAGHDKHTATLNVYKGTGSGTVYASTSGSATSGSASASFDCGKSSDGQHTGTLYAYATPASGYTFLGWTTSASSSAGADNANPKGVAFDVSSGNSTQTLYAHFVEKAKVNITFEAPSNGTYTIAVNGGSAETVSSANVVKSNVTGVTLTATPASGYAFAGWYKLNSAGEFVEDLSIASPYDASFTASGTIRMGARFVPVTLGKFILKGSSTQYYGLKMATIAAGGSGTIVPVAEETLVDGSDLMPFDNGTYTIKAGATLLVPHTADNKMQLEPDVVTTAETLSAYRTLVLKDGVKIVSNGNICVGGKIMSAGGGNKSAYVTGPCGVINMANGGHIELNSGAKLYCWGFIKGQDMDQGNNTVGVGTITAHSGAIIKEDFSVGDWRGGTATYAIYDKQNAWKLFPFQSYSIQNVEVPTTYEYGSTLNTFVVVNGGGGNNPADFDIAGSSNTLFLLKNAQSTVRKWYDPTTDLTCYELSGTAQLDALNLVVYISVSSSDYYLPISNSMHIILKNCNMTLSKPMTMQAGSVIEIKEDATANLESRLHMFDKDEWGKYIHDYYFRSFNNLTSHKNRGAENSNEGLEDAKIIVDGTLNVVSGKGYLYSTNGGANIMGNGGGKVVFGGALPSSTTLHHVTVGTKAQDYIVDAPNDIAAANLCNEDGSYTKAIASKTFLNIHGRWFNQTDGASTIKANHTYDFTYISSGAVSGTGGTSSTTDALYAPDKTGLAAGMKWCNVAQDGPCSNIFNATQALNETPASDIRYTYPSSSWLQLLKTETEGVYGGSDNSLYAVEGCAVNSLGSVDENCLYTINEVKKALVDGHFVALEKNTNDEAWHDVANPTNYYISFVGCTWHPATKEVEEKAYTVEGGIYIWYGGDWKLVEREAPYFFDYNDQNVKRYYEYEDGAWVLASPRVRVQDAIETRDFYFLPEAFTVANGKKNTTITLLKDIPMVATSLTYSAKNTTCTLDLNGHTMRGSVATLLEISAPGSTFTITDNSTEKNGRLENIFSLNEKLYNVKLSAGTLNFDAGTIYVKNTAQYHSSNLKSCEARGIQVTAEQKLYMTGGRVESYATRNAYGVLGTGSAANKTELNISGGSIYAEAPCGAVGINSSGKLNFGGTAEVEAHLNTDIVNAAYAADNADNNLNKHQTCYGINMTASANATASSCYFGTLNVTGGTIKASSALVRSYTSNVFGVRMYYSVAGKGNRNFASTSGTNAEQACAIGSIKNATIELDTKANYGYGVAVYGHYNSFNKSNSIVKVENTEITVTAQNYAYGVYSIGAIDGTTGEYVTGDVELTNCTVTAEATADYAYATFVYSGQTTIYKDKQANYYGEYATAAKMTINSGNYTARTTKSTAYAACSNTRAKSIYNPETSVEADRTLGEGKEAYPTLIIKNGTFTAEATTTTARAVSSGGNTTITGGTFNATATKYYAYGLYAVAGTLEASNITVNATANGRVSSSDNNAYAYGVYADCGIIGSGNQPWTGYTYASDVELNNCTVNATASAYNNARGLSVEARQVLLTQANYEAEKTKRGWSAATWAAYQAVFPGDNTSRAVAAKATVNGGTFTVTAGNATAYGAISTKTVVTNTQGAMASPEMTLNNATFIVKSQKSTGAYGVYSGGPTLIDGCTITATAGDPTIKNTASGVLNVDKITKIKNSTITATSADAAYGLEGRAEINATHGYCWHGEFDLTEAGNTIVTAEAKTKAKTAYTIFLKSAKLNIATGGAFDGDYATAASATINGGTYNAKFNTSGSAYVISLGSQQTQGDAVAQPEVEVLGGFFNGATAEVGTAGVVGHMQLKGGYFVHNTNLATYAVAPKSVWTLPNTHEHYNPYYYKIAEHYNIVFMNGTTQLQQNDMEVGSIPAYTSTPTKDADAQYTYTFDGWSTTDGGDKLASLPAVSADATYFAHYSKTEKKYAVSIAAGANGSVSPASVSGIGCETASGDITATPNVGYSFSGWTLPEGVTAADGYTVTSNPIRIHATAAGKTITANFVARTDINYTVKHWQQNIENDEYTEVTADQETKQGTTATLTAATAKSYTGFTARPITQETIAGEGTTVVNIYYNRNKYTVTWVDGDGETIETDENVKYGATPVYNGETPPKTGTAQYSYTFNGWSPAVGDVVGNATYTATFTKTVNTYTITWKNKNGDILDTDEVAYGATPVYDGTPTQEPTVNEVFTFRAWTPEISSVTEDAIYTADYTASPRPYPVKWVNYDGEVLKEDTRNYGWDAPAATAYDGERPIREGSNGKTYAFAGWSDPVSEVPGGDVTYTALFGTTIVAHEDNTVTISANETVDITTVHVSGTLSVEEGATLTTEDLILEATPSTSGEITGAARVQATRHAYFDLTPDGNDGTHNRKWYAFAVPWEVDAETGVYNKDNMNAPLGLGTRFDILYYDGALRQAQGNSSKCWKFLEYDLDKTLKPGKLYMIHVAGAPIETIRFEKKSGSAIHNSTIEVAVNTGADNNMDANWNGIANPATYKSAITIDKGGASKAFSYGGGMIGADGWIATSMGNALVVGQPIMVQVKNGGSAALATGPHNSPVRRAQQTQSQSQEYAVEISKNGNLCDRLFVDIDEEKEPHYVIGSDLTKVGQSTARAQMWINRYDTKLSVNTVAPQNNKAEYPLSIYAPNAGEYMIEATKIPEEGSYLYLTYDGAPIWNLNYNGYMASLEAGTTDHYGLRLVLASPQVATSIEEAVVDAQGEIRKVLINDQVFIIRGEKVYTIDGQLVK